MSFVGLLNTTCSIQSKVQSQGSSGQINETWSNVQTDVPTRKVEDRNGRVVEVLGKVTTLTIAFYFEPHIALNDGQQIVHGDDTYTIAHVSLDSSNHHKVAMCERVSFV